MQTIVIQAGGRGTRLQEYTANIPKPLITIGNTTLLYHNLDVLHSLFPSCNIHIIADHHSSIILSYLKAYPHPSKPSVHLAAHRGTASGLAAIHSLEPESGIIFLWCDLLLSKDSFEELDLTSSIPLVGVTSDFPCRWSHHPTFGLKECPSQSRGVAGIFFLPTCFCRHSALPNKGEFVRWLSVQVTPLSCFDINGTLELGDYNRYRSYLDQHSNNRSRFFNRLELSDKIVVKSCIDRHYEHLIEAELKWYNYVETHGYGAAPRLVSKRGLVLERLSGNHPDQISPQSSIISSIIGSLRSLHGLETRPSNKDDLSEMYVAKTLERLKEVEPLLPLDRSEICINSRMYMNPVHPSNLPGFIEIMNQYLVDEAPDFNVIHGDPTFSNILYNDSSQRAFLIDPRGRFGSNAIFGDPDYDWAKLLYSIEGSYDKVNTREFFVRRLDDGNYLLSVPLSGYEKYSDLVYSHASSSMRVRLIHATLWFGLAGYIKNHLDSITASFLKGCMVYDSFLSHRLRLSALPKTWFIDIDGTIVAHNSCKEQHSDVVMLPGVEAFLSRIADSDTIFLTTSRPRQQCICVLNAVSKIFKGRLLLVDSLGHGERILINDLKPSGLQMAYSLNLRRDAGFNAHDFTIDHEI